jgi:hypothetical protein
MVALVAAHVTAEGAESAEIFIYLPSHRVTVSLNLLVELLTKKGYMMTGTTYFVHNAGNDDNTGTALDQAWCSVERASRQVFAPGDSLFFAGEEEFVGGLTLRAETHGTPEAPITVGSYGTGRAMLRVERGDGVRVENLGGVVMRDLVVRGPGPGGPHHSGIAVLNTLPKAALIDHIRIDNIDVGGFSYCGILVGGAPADGSKSGYRDVRITRCDAHDNAYYGMLLTSSWDVSATTIANRDVYVGYCRVYGNHGDPEYMDNHSGSGMLLEDVDGGLIEHCVAFNNGALCRCRAGGPTGIWAAVANNIVIQYCESFNNRTSSRADGGGFDFDGGTTNSVMQFNYSHDNDGAGFMFYTYPGSPHSFHHNVMRHNVSRNDGRKNGYAGIFVENHGSGISDVEIAYNTVFMAPSAEATPVALRTAHTNRVHYHHNHFIAEGVPLLRGNGAADEASFADNTFWASDDVFSLLWNDERYASVEAWQAAQRTNSF